MFYVFFSQYFVIDLIGHDNTCWRNVICFLKETSNKDLSTLAKAAFELLEWRIFWEPHLQEAVSVILSSAIDSNWRTRSATLTYLQTFMHRYGFLQGFSFTPRTSQLYKVTDSNLTRR